MEQLNNRIPFTNGEPSIDVVMKNLSVASVKDIRNAIRSIEKEMEGLKRNTNEFQELANKKLTFKKELLNISHGRT